MSGHGAKLAVTFAVSLVLHAAGLWAVAARIEPHQAKSQGEVELVDRELFFRHAPVRRVERSGPVSAGEHLQPRDTEAAVPARTAAQSIAPVAGEAVAPADAEVARQYTPEQRLAGTSGAETSRPVRNARVLAAQEAPERIGPASQTDSAEPVEARGSLGAARPGERLASATVEVAEARQVQPRDTLDAAPSGPRLTRADSAFDAQPADALTTLTAAEPDDRFAMNRSTPEAVRPVSVRRRAPATGSEEVLEPADDNLDPASPAAPLALMAESPQRSSRAPIVARRLGPDATSVEAERASPRAVVVAPMTGSAIATQTTEPVTAERATPSVIVPDKANAVQQQGMAATMLAPSGSRQAAPAVAPPVPVGRPAATLAPANDAARPQVPPRTPERLAALGPRQVVDSGPVASMAPTTEPARLPPATAPDTARVADRVAPRSSTAAVSAPRAAVGVGALPDAQRIGSVSPQSDAPAAEETLTITPVPPLPEPQTPVPRAPQRLAAIDPADRFTRSYKGGECFIAIRTASAEDTKIVSYAAQLRSVLKFKEAFAQALDTEPSVGWQHVTDAQCSGISFARLVLGDSAPSLTIQLDHKEIVSGGSLSGRLSEDTLEHVAMLLVDDEGMVHILSKFLRRDADGIELFIPQLHAIRDGKRKVHLLMAISASTALPALDSDEAIHSDDFFAQLLQQVRDTGAEVELGLDHFVVF